MCACVLVHVDKCSVIFTPVPGLISPQHICLPSFPPTICIRIWELANTSGFSPEEKKNRATMMPLHSIIVILQGATYCVSPSGPADQ